MYMSIRYRMHAWSYFHHWLCICQVRHTYIHANIHPTCIQTLTCMYTHVLTDALSESGEVVGGLLKERKCMHVRCKCACNQKACIFEWVYVCYVWVCVYIYIHTYERKKRVSVMHTFKCGWYQEHQDAWAWWTISETSCMGVAVGMRVSVHNTEYIKAYMAICVGVNMIYGLKMCVCA